MTPVPTPVISQMKAAPPASEAVTGIRADQVRQTGCWVRKEYPKHGAGQCSVDGPLSYSCADEQALDEAAVLLVERIGEAEPDRGLVDLLPAPALLPT